MTKISSGIKFLDHLLGFLKTGDNVIWEVEAGTYVEIFLHRFVEHSLKNGSKVVYVSFNASPSTLSKSFQGLSELGNLTILDCFTSGKGNDDPIFSRFYEKEERGFDGHVVRVANPRNVPQFRVAMDRIEVEKGSGIRYVFDSLTGMQDIWGDESATFKFFTYSCPRLYDLQTIAYWVLEKEAHSSSFKANLRHITQVAIELEKSGGDLSLRVIIIKGRFSRSVFLPKRYEVWDHEVIFPSIGGRKPGNLGEKIRLLRRKLGMTQKELAAQVGLTPSFISQLEKDLISPSLDSLLKLSEKLNTQPIYFLADEEVTPQKKMILRSGERQELHPKEFRTKDVKLQLLVPDGLNRRMESYLVTLKKGMDIPGHLFKFKGDEFVYILEGEVEVELDGKRHHLKPGDTLYLDSSFPSHWSNAGKGEATLIYVLSPPGGV